jgi:hypothetical protein
MPPVPEPADPWFPSGTGLLTRNVPATEDTPPAYGAAIRCGFEQAGPCKGLHWRARTRHVLSAICSR